MISPDTALHYKTIRAIKDPIFNVEHIDQYALLISVGIHDCQLEVIDTKKKQVILIEDYIFPKETSWKQVSSLMKEIFENHHVLSARFWGEVIFCIKNEKFVQMPSSLFLAREARSYLAFNARIDDGDEVLHYLHKNQPIVTVFACCNNMIEWIKNTYQNTSVCFVHQSVALIEGTLLSYTHHASNQNSPLHVYVDRFKLHITLVHKDKLIYYNQFPIVHFNDYIKYIMLVITEMKINPKTSPLSLWGYAKKKSAYFNVLTQYVKNVRAGKRPYYLRFGYLFDELEDYNYSDLHAVYLLSKSYVNQPT